MTQQEEIYQIIKTNWKLERIKNEQGYFNDEPNNKQIADFYNDIKKNSGLINEDFPAWLLNYCYSGKDILKLRSD